MAKDSKFGTFGGVFTPSILTILGVIMYLRLPWVIGNAGLHAALGIILVAHVISVSTGLSISSIATDKNVGAGGPYYIVSRSLGLPIGGTLGVALFIGLCFSTSLYVIGFSESFLSVLEIEATPTAIRICGTVTLVLLTAVTLISTAFAIKTQYIILVLIALSLVSIFMGSSGPAPAPTTPAPSGDGPSIDLMFGIFFPAVTGFTAGVNMSGDLRNPKQSIPRGTMLAIVVGLAVYVSLTVFLALRVPAAMLEDEGVLIQIAWIPALVVAGIWGATLSSGLGSILGAPRILQALSSDAIMPRVFARGHGKTNEPRNALVLAFALAEGGILIAELNAIARIVSMVFLAMYGFLNISCAIESWASPDFRPAFRIPRMVSVVGAVTCVVIMIQLDLPAMLGAITLMVGLFLWLQRKQLQLDAGDAWEGIWSSLIRAGLYRLTHERKQQRNWRPNILLFRAEGSATRPLARFGEALITGNGILTDFELQEGRRRKKEDPDPTPESRETEDERPMGIFRRTLSANDPFEVIGGVCKHYGFAGLEPNTLLLSWSMRANGHESFARLLDEVSGLDFNVLVHSHGEPKPGAEGVDVWWRADAGNIGFALALLRFMTQSSEWEDAPLRFLVVSSDTSNNDNLRTTMRRILKESRVEATLKILNDTFADRSFEDRVRDLSESSSLTIMGLPNETGGFDEEEQERTDKLVRQLGSVLLVRGSSSFEELLPTGREAAVSFLPPFAEDGDAPEKLPELRVSDTPDLARAAGELAAAYQHLVSSFHELCIKKLYGRNVEVVRSIQAAARKHLKVDKALSAANPRRQRTAFNRLQSSFLLDCRNLLDEFEEKQLPDLRSVLEGGIDAFVSDENVVDRSDDPEELVVQRDQSAFEPEEGDSAYVRSFKRRRRLLGWFRREPPSYRIPVAKLRAYYFDRAIRSMVQPTARQFVTDSQQIAIHLGKILNSTRAAPPDEEAGVSLADVLDEQRRQLDEHLEELAGRGKTLVNRHQWQMLVGALELAQAYADDIERLDVLPLIRSDRKVENRDALSAELDELSEQWLVNQRHLLGRAKLALSLSGFQHRLATIAGREREAIALGIKNGALSECVQLMETLRTFRSELEKGADATRVQIHIDFKNQFDPKPIIDDLVRECSDSTDELPESIHTLTDEGILALEEGRTDGLGTMDLPVRRLVQFLVETELIGGVQEALASVPQLEQQATGVAQDVIRLVTFQISELDGGSDLSPAEFAEHMVPVVDNGIERLRGQIEKLSAITPTLQETVDEKLHLVVDGSNAYDLSTASDKLEQHIRVHQGKRAVSGARGFLRRGAKTVRSAMVRALYGRSAGVLLARERQAAARTGDDRVVDRVSSLVQNNSPRPEVLEHLPFYYRQLFFGQSAINDTFWVDREAQLAKAKRAIASFRRGASGAVFVIGERLSGKSVLVQRVTTELLEKRPVYRVHAPPGGSIDLTAFHRALRKALELDGEIPELFSALPEGAVIVLDDLQMWWERSPAGLEVIQQVLNLIERYGKRTLFVMALGTQPFHFISRLLPLADSALAILDCTPMPAEALKSIVTLRHASTGLKFEFESKSEDELGDWRLARLFSDYFEYSGGVVGVALRAWIHRIRRLRDDSLEIERPDAAGWEAIDALGTERVAMLLELVLHKQLSLTRLRRITGFENRDLRREIDALIRMGLVVESRQRVVEINPDICHIVHSRFSKRGLIA